VDSARDVLLRCEGLLKRIEKHLRPEGEGDQCPACGSDDLDEMPGVMGEDFKRFRCGACNRAWKQEAVNG
jgi:hypothetical protein